MLVNVLQNGNGGTEIASVYNIATQTFTPFHFSTNAFCAGHSVAQDGTAIIAGKPSHDSNRLSHKDRIISMIASNMTHLLMPMPYLI